MVEVEVLVKNVDATRLSDQPADETSVTFDVAASLAETDHTAGSFTLKYSIAITSQPPVARMDVAGSARITGEEAEIEALLLNSQSSELVASWILRSHKQLFAMKNGRVRTILEIAELD